jgi:phosphoglycerate dehydrogenase-like enzyme
MNIAIGVVSEAEAWVLPRHFADILRARFPQHAFLDAWDRDALRRVLPDADAAFAAFVDRDLVASLPRLKWVQAPAAGVGHFLSAEFVASPIVLTSARGVRARAMAEHVLAVMFALARQLPLAFRRQMEHRWALDEIERAGSVRTLAGRRLGIVGLGAIGGEVARLGAACGMRVSAVRKRADRPKPEGVEAVLPPAGLAALLAASDVVVLCAAQTPETRTLIGPTALQAVKRGAFLINVARGKMVDDEAVIEALRDGRLGGAALDVFAEEPLDPSSPYWDLPNVIVTPHSSGTMEDYWTPLVDLFSENLRRFERGDPLLNMVDKTAGY